MIYLDCNATTPIDPEVLKVVRHYMEVEFGNAGSRTHEYGLRAKQAVERAREQVAAVVKAKPDEVIFTSGATESNNLAILGLEAEGRRSKRMHIVSTQIEHKAVLEPLEEMRRRGFEVTLLAPNRHGWVEPAGLEAALRPDTLLVSIMHVNNETGVVQPIEELCAMVSRSSSYFHVDSAQGFARIPGLHNKRIDLISLSGHKISAPKGVGALVVRRRGWQAVPLTPLFFGGGQEKGLRPGTLPVHLIAGLGAASERARLEQPTRMQLCAQIRATVLRELEGCFDIVGDPARSAPWTLCLRMPGVDSEAVMLIARDIGAISNGSACTSSEYSPSHVLTAMGLSPSEAGQVIRISWCHATAGAKAELDLFLRSLRNAVRSAVSSG